MRLKLHDVCQLIYVDSKPHMGMDPGTKSWLLAYVSIVLVLDSRGLKHPKPDIIVWEPKKGKEKHASADFRYLYNISVYTMIVSLYYSNTDMYYHKM